MKKTFAGDFRNYLIAVMSEEAPTTGSEQADRTEELKTMNKSKYIIAIGMALTLAACGAGLETETGNNTNTNTESKDGSNTNTSSNTNSNTNSGNTTSSNNQNTYMDPIAPQNAGNGTFPNGIWEATGKRDVLFTNPPILGESYAGGMMITNTTLDIYEALQADGAINGSAPCFRPTTGIEWSTWPTAIGGFDGVDFVFDGSYESGMQRSVLVQGENQEKLYYTYVGPVTAASAAAFRAKYATACQ